MKWRKLGLVFGVSGYQQWAKTHSMVPTPVRISDDLIRIFFTSCDDHGVGRPGYVDVLVSNPLDVISVSNEPLLDVGQPGSFDENGVLVCSVVKVNESQMYMYYVGFELGTKIRYRLLTGLAVSNDLGKTFHRYSEVPVLERSDEELFFRGGPHCIFDGGRFRLWYVGGSDWIDVAGKQMPVYDVRYAESKNGVDWPASGTVVLKPSQPDEFGFGRPYIVKKTSTDYQMFYSIRRTSFNAYRLGYAQSSDGLNWIRRDSDLGLDVSPNTFDSDAIMYSSVITLENKTYLFYNGNNFGQDGFAVAELVHE